MTGLNRDGAQNYDLLLKGGHVIDPANAIDSLMDVGISGRRILHVAPDISSSASAKTLDISGLIVTPGILDIHTHVYKFRPTDKNYIEGIHADAHLLASGVTTTVDAGTAGWQHFTDFIESSIERSRVRILAFINIARGGMVNAESEQRPEDMNPRVAAALAQAFPEIVVGIKTAHYWTRDAWDDQHPAWASVDRAVDAGEQCGKPVMVDFWPRPPVRSYPELILSRLRPGDIHTHVFAQQFPVLTDEGKVSDFLFKARERGVLFDLGHGAASFWFRNAVPAYNGGFPPDSISTDLHTGNIYGPVISMLHTMSKFLSIGMPLSEVILRSTSLPAQMIHHPELGTLSPGAEADVAVFQAQEGDFSFTDCGRTRLAGKKRLECRLTIRAGEIMYDPTGLSMPGWDHAPANIKAVP